MSKPAIDMPRAQKVLDERGCLTRPYEDHFEVVTREVKNLSDAFAGVDTLSGSAGLVDVINTLNTLISTMKAQ